jgi:Leucine-rich repeat (LRR) protein
MQSTLEVFFPTKKAEVKVISLKSFNHYTPTSEEQEKLDLALSKLKKFSKCSFKKIFSNKIEFSDSRFRIVKYLGEGHFGSCYALQKEGSDTIYAAKCFLKDVYLNEDNPELFEMV